MRSQTLQLHFHGHKPSPSQSSLCGDCECKAIRRHSFHFASAFVAIIFSQLMASSSASWRLNKPPYSFVIGHKSTICTMVCCSPQSQSGDGARPHLCMLAWHGPWPVWKRLNSVQEWRGRSKPGCWIVGSHTRWLLTTAADNQSSSNCTLWSTVVVSDQIGCRVTRVTCHWQIPNYKALG